MHRILGLKSGGNGAIGQGSDSFLADVHVQRIDLVTDEASHTIASGDGRGTTSHERIEDRLLLEGVKLNKAFDQCHGKRGRMPYSPGRFRRDVPHAAGGCKEFVSRDSGMTALSSIEALLGENEHVLVEIPERGI